MTPTERKAFEALRESHRELLKIVTAMEARRWSAWNTRARAMSPDDWHHVESALYRARALRTSSTG